MSKEIKRQRKRDVVRGFFGGGSKSPQPNPAIPMRPAALSSAQAASTPSTASPAGQVVPPSTPKPAFSEAVLSSLEPDEQALVRKHLADNAGKIGDAVQKAYDAALAQKKKCASKRWRFNLRGRDVVLRDEADKVVRWIARFRSVGDVVANVDPIHVGLPWAGILIILQVLVTGSHQMAIMLSGMNLATYMVDRLQVYLDWRTRLPSTPTTIAFEKALVRMYVIVLQFFDGFVETPPQSSTTRAWKALWTESELDDFESRCQEWAIQVDIDANMCDRELSQQERDETRRWREATLAPALDRITDVLTGQQAAKHRAMIDWLSPPDPYRNHYSACKKHEPGTGTWLLQSREYERWKTSDNTLLWLTGQAGCGKTVLCSTVIEDVRSHCQSIPDARFAIFYFSFSETQKQSYAGFLSSLVAQIARSKVGFNKMQLLHDRVYPSRPSTEALEDIVTTCLHQRGATTLVLDALDELPESGDNDGRPAVMEWLERVMQRTDQSLKIFITSRRLADIEGSVMSLGARCVVLRPDLANNDIRHYVATELERHPKLRAFSADTKEKIKDVFEQKSDGMFRWAFCQLEELKKLKLTRPRFVEEALRRLPSTLDGTYERMLLRIDDFFREEALKALRWLAFEERPLTLEELAEACLVDYTAEDPVDLDGPGRADEILELLAGLVLVESPEGYQRDEEDYDSDEEDDESDEEDDESDEEDFESDEKDNESECEDCESDEEEDYESEEEDVFRQGKNPSHNSSEEFKTVHIGSWSAKSRVRLAHFSVKEYLLSDRITEGKAAGFALREDRDHQILAQSCLAYMLHYSRNRSKTPSKQDLKTFPLLRYAAKTWTTLIPKHQLSPTAYEILLLQSKKYKTDWLRVYQPDEDYLQPFEESPWNSGSALYYTSLLGLVSASQKLIDERVDLTARGGWFGNALQAASYRGHVEVVKLLLDGGAVVNARGGFSETALLAASGEGNVEVVKLLIDSGAEINAQGGFYGNALQFASHNGHVEVVKLLLDKGAKVNRQGGNYGNALYAASYRGYLEIVKLLMNSRADVNASGGEYGNALRAALHGSHAEVAVLLLKSGANTNAPGGDFGDALQAASFEGYVEVVKLLVDGGAGVNDAHDGYFGNALQAASYGGHVEVVKFLLKKGAKINPQRGEFTSALHAAAFQDNEDVARKLLGHGADLTATDSHGWTPAMIASAYGRSKVAKLLGFAKGATTISTELTPGSLFLASNPSKLITSIEGLVITAGCLNYLHVVPTPC